MHADSFTVAMQWFCTTMRKTIKRRRFMRRRGTSGGVPSLCFIFLAKSCPFRLAIYSTRCPPSSCRPVARTASVPFIATSKLLAGCVLDLFWSQYFSVRWSKSRGRKRPQLPPPGAVFWILKRATNGVPAQSLCHASWIGCP